MAKSGIKGADQARRDLVDEKRVPIYNLPRMISVAGNNFIGTLLVTLFFHV